MAGNASAYESLGLRPDADQAAVEIAYRRLIKRYHPDRAGGDSARAAEINQAYYELRKSSGQPLERAQPVDLAEALYAERLARRRVMAPKKRQPRIWPLVAIALAIILYLKREPLLASAGDLRTHITEKLTPSRPDEDQGLTFVADLHFDTPIDLSGVDQAVARAVALARSGDNDALAEESRECHQIVRSEPSLALLDRCAAFDDAVLEIENRGTAPDGGVFSASAVTARQMAAAKLLSSNYEAIEERLDRVRSHVQRALVPPEPVTLPGSGVTEPASGAASGLPPLVSGTDGPATH